jgi:hypothetical protein
MPLKVKKVTGPTIAASVLFNGSNQYLSLPNTSTMQMGTSDYTVEAWIYPTANGQANGSNIFSQSAYGVSSQFIIFLNSSNKIGNYIEYDAGGGSAGPIITGTTSITLNTWTHVAVSRVSGVTRIFINGVLRATSKSFDIPHPTKEGYRLVYGCLEGPENGVYHRGKISGNGDVFVELPEYWSELVAEYTISLTSYGNYPIFVHSQSQKGFVVRRCGGFFSRRKFIEFSFEVFGSRRDAPLQVEYKSS